MKKEIKKQSIEEEYNIKGKDGEPFKIPVKGSIPLLALGYRGIMAWRAKRIEAEKINSKNKLADGKKAG